MVPLNALILVGGKSSRMGREKGKLLNNAGVEVWRSLFTILEDLCSGDVYLSQRNQQEYHKNHILDQFEGIGPMGGIASALASFPDAAWVVVACDLFLLNKETIVSLIEERDRESDATVYQQVGSSFLEPLCGIYEPSIYSPIRQSIEKGEYGLNRLLKTVKTKVVLCKNSQSLININTSEDYITYKKAF